MTYNPTTDPRIEQVKARIRQARATGAAAEAARALDELRRLRAEQAAEALTSGAGVRVWLDERTEGQR